MVDVTKDDEVNAIKALSGAFSQSVTQLATASQDQMMAIMGVAALVACLPDTQHIPPQRIGAIISLLAQGRPDADAFKEKLAKFVAMVMTASGRLAEAETAAKAATGAPASPATH
jgi:hypothetical protein